MAAAPTGWTRSATTYDHALVLTDQWSYLGGTTGGTTNFTTVHTGTAYTASATNSWFSNPTSPANIDIPSHTHSGSVNARGTGYYGTTQQGYTFPASFYPSSPTAPRRPTYYPYVTAQNAPNFSQNDWSDAAPNTLVNMGSLIPGNTYTIAAIGSTTQDQWNTLTGVNYSLNPWYVYNYNRAVGDSFVATGNGAGFGTGQVRPENSASGHFHTTSVSGTFTSSGTKSYNLGVKYVDLILASKNGIYGVTFLTFSGSQTVIKGSSISTTWDTTTVPNGSTIYYTLSSFSDGLGTTPLSGSFVTTNAITTLSVTIIDNGFNSGGSFIIQVRSDSTSGPIMAFTPRIIIGEPANPTATFTSVPASITEGTSGTFVFTSTRIKNGDMLTYNVINGTSSNIDFLNISGNVTVNSNTGTFTITPKIDLLKEIGALGEYDTFRVSLSTSSGSVLATTTILININDVPPTVTFSGLPTTINSLTTGTVTFTTTNVPSGTQLPWSIDLLGSTQSSDFSPASSSIVNIYNNTGTIYIVPSISYPSNDPSTTQISSGRYVQSVLNSNGILCQAGSSLGDGTTDSKSRPVQIGTSKWKKVSSKNNVSYAIRSDNTLWAWGTGSGNGWGNGTTGNYSVPTQVGSSLWVQVTSTNSNGFAIRIDGTLWGWGYNAQGQLGDSTVTTRTSMVQISGGGTNWSKLSNTGDDVSGAFGAIKSNGTLWVWGFNAYYGLGDGTAVNKSIPIQIAGSWSMVSIGSDISAGIKTDGTLFYWGFGTASTPTTSAQLSGMSFTMVSASQNHIGAIRTDKTLWMFDPRTIGFGNTYGQLGQGDTVARTSWVQVPGSWAQVAVSNNATFAVKTDGTIWSWGRNEVGQLGLGDTINRSSPVTTPVWSEKVFTVSVKDIPNVTTFNTSQLITIPSSTISFATPKITNINEGQTVSYTINTTNITNGTKLLWRAEVFSGTADIFISTTQLTINSVLTGSVAIGTAIIGPGIPINTYITAFVGLSEGGIGIYTMSANATSNGIGIAVSSASISDLVSTSGLFDIKNNVGVFSISSVPSPSAVGTKTFNVNIFDSTGSICFTLPPSLSTLVTVADTYAGGIYKFITPAMVILEGLSITLQFESNINSGTLYWTIDNISTSNADFTGSVVSGTITLNGSTVIDSTNLNQRYLQSFTISTTALDGLVESTESFTVSLRTVSITGTVVATSNTISIIDTPASTYYLVNPSIYLNEGTSTTYTVNTTNVNNGTIFYWDIAHGTTTNADFSAVSGSFTITNNTGSFTLTTTLDGLLEGDEFCTLNVRTTTALTGPIFDYRLLIIRDTSISPTYTFVNPITVIAESSSAVYTVNITGAIPTTYYWTIAHVTTAAADFIASSGSFTTTGTSSLNSGLFSIAPTQDASTEGAQTFTIQLRTSSTSGTVVATTPSITITDTSLNPTYAFVNPITTIYEGEVISYTVNITDVAVGTTLYWTTTLSTVVAADFTGSVVSGSFTKNTGTFSSGTGTFTVSLSADALTEGTETFTIQARTGSLTGTVVANSPIITVINTSDNPTYTFVTPATSINEGVVTTYNLNTTDVLVGSSLYWTIAHGTTAAADFSSTSGSFVVNSRLINNSVYFGGAGYLSISTGNNLALGSGNWTIEFWIFMDSMYPQNIICDWRVGGSGGNDPRPVIYVEGQTFIWREGGVDVLKLYSSVAYNSWQHWAIVRDGSYIQVYIDGLNTGGFQSNTPSNYNNDTGIFQIGKAWDSNYWHGYITNFRIVKDVALYTESFTVPTTKLKNISGTLLLACQGPTVTTDNSRANNRLPWTIATGGTAPTISDNVINFVTENTTGTVSAGTGTFAITTAADYITEGSETFTIQARTGSITGTVVATSPTITINDTTLFTTGQEIWANYTGTVVNWVAPPGAVRMSAVVIGGGGGSYYDSINLTSSGGGGGALSYANNIPITPGATYRIFVGKNGTSGQAGGLSYILDAAGNQLLGAYAGGGSSGAGGSGGLATATCTAAGAVRYAGGGGGQVGVYPYTGLPGSAATYTSNGTYSVPGGTSLLGSAGLTYKLGSGGVNGGVRIMWWTDTTANYRAYPNTNTGNM